MFKYFLIFNVVTFFAIFRDLCKIGAVCFFVNFLFFFLVLEFNFSFLSSFFH
jgi:hypothetical protein